MVAIYSEYQARVLVVAMLISGILGVVAIYSEYQARMLVVAMLISGFLAKLVIRAPA